MRRNSAAALVAVALVTPAFARAGDDCAGAAARHAATGTGETLVALARCHEVRGKTASAWVEYLEAAALAKRDKRREIEAAARRRATALEPRLAKLAVTVPPGFEVPDLEVRRDDLVLVRAAWGTAAPVDPGEHRVVATAPGKKRWTRVIVVEGGADETVAVGPLEDDEEPVATTTVSSASWPEASGGDRQTAASPGTAQRILGLGLAGAGLAAVGAGVYFGLEALDARDAAKAACPTSPCADRAAVARNEEARSAATLSTIGLAAGGGAALLGAILFFTAPREDDAKRGARRPSIAPSLGPSFAGLRLEGEVP